MITKTSQIKEKHCIYKEDDPMYGSHIICHAHVVLQTIFLFAKRGTESHFKEVPFGAMRQYMSQAGDPRSQNCTEL